MKHILIFLLFACTFAFGQTNDTNEVSVSTHLLKGNLLFAPSITYEYGITRTSTAKAEIGTSLTLFEYFGETRVGFFSKFETQYKYYYNLSKRALKGKEIKNNSGNFIALDIIYNGEKDFFSSAERISELLLIGPVWGIQRSYESGFSFLFEIGLGYDFMYAGNKDQNGRPFPILGFEIGWILFGK